MKALHISNRCVRPSPPNSTLTSNSSQATMVVRNDQYVSSWVIDFCVTEAGVQVMILGEICNFAGVFHATRLVNQV